MSRLDYFLRKMMPKLENILKQQEQTCRNCEDVLAVKNQYTALIVTSGKLFTPVFFCSPTCSTAYSFNLYVASMPDEEV